MSAMPCLRENHEGAVVCVYIHRNHSHQTDLKDSINFQDRRNMSKGNITTITIGFHGIPRSSVETLTVKNGNGAKVAKMRRKGKAGRKRTDDELSEFLSKGATIIYTKEAESSRYKALPTEKDLRCHCKTLWFMTNTFIHFLKDVFIHVRFNLDG